MLVSGIIASRRVRYLGHRQCLKSNAANNRTLEDTKSTICQSDIAIIECKPEDRRDPKKLHELVLLELDLAPEPLRESALLPAFDSDEPLSIWSDSYEHAERSSDVLNPFEGSS